MTLSLLQSGNKLAICEATAYGVYATASNFTGTAAKIPLPANNSLIRVGKYLLSSQC